MKTIDVESWNRRTQYENFIRYTNPIISVCTTLDVTPIVERCRVKGLSFFSSFLYLVTKSVNEVDEMKLRIDGDRIVMPDCVHPSYVVLCGNGELRTCKTLFDPDFGTFYRKTREDIDRTKARESAAYNESRQTDCFYLSCLPWVRLNAVTNPYNLTDRE